MTKETDNRPGTTTVEVDGKKVRKWTPEYSALRAAKRREKYAQDNAYREKVKARSRGRWSEEKNPHVAERPREVRENIAKMGNLGEVREVFVGLASVGDEHCFTAPELAEVLGVNPQTFGRMVMDGRWPAPIFSCRNNKTRTGVFLRDEAEALAAVYADHLERSAHYYKPHVETRERLYKTATEVRQKTRLGQWAMQQALEAE